MEIAYTVSHSMLFIFFVIFVARDTHRCYTLSSQETWPRAEQYNNSVTLCIETLTTKMHDLDFFFVMKRNNFFFYSNHFHHVDMCCFVFFILLIFQLHRYFFPTWFVLVDLRLGRMSPSATELIKIPTLIQSYWWFNWVIESWCNSVTSYEM